MTERHWFTRFLFVVPAWALVLLLVTPTVTRGEQARPPRSQSSNEAPPATESSEPALPALEAAKTSRASGDRAIELDVYGGVRDLYKIAIPAPRGDSGMAKQVQAIATRDLEISSLFKVLDPRSFLDEARREGATFDADAWRAVGAQGVVKGEVSGRSKGIQLEMKLYETGRGASPVLTKTYSGPASDLRPMVHRFVNDLIGYFTGDPGVFGSRILFSRMLGRGHKEIFSVEMDGESLSQHTKNGSINVLPAWGPGGSIFYTSFVNGWAQIFRGGQKRPVLSESGLNMGAAISPRGGKMAVVVSRDGNSDIFLANLDGSGLQNLTRHPGIDVSPSWSPDGSQIAFVSNRHGTPQIFVMDANGGGARRVTFAGAYNQTPSWCPRADTPLIAFTGADGGTFDIFTVDSNGGAISRLTQSQGRNTDPTWSPDGRLIAFWSSRGGIYTMTPQGLNQQLILRGHAETLRWSTVVPGR